MLRFVAAYLIYTWGVLHRYYGNKNSVNEEYTTAVHYFSRALKIDPDLRLPRLHRGVLLWRELGQPKAALDDMNALLAQDPQDGEALFNRAMAFQALGQFGLALADLEAYLALPGGENYRDTAVRTAALLRELTGSQ